MHPIHIIAAKRTPIGKFGGGLKDLPPADLAAHVANATVPENLRERVSEIILGQVLQSGSGMNVARQTGLRIGVPHSTPAFTVNMACGSALKAVALATNTLQNPQHQLALAGGVENMSAAPFLLPELRWGKKLGASTILDSIQNDGLTDPFLHIGMGETAERIAELLRISREEQDAFAATSQALAHTHRDAFAREIVPVTNRKDTVEQDEHPRSDTTTTSLAKLKPAFRTNGSVTPGNSSGINDGAAMLLLAREDALQASGLQSRARIVASCTTGCDPATMGLGPVTAIEELLRIAGWSRDSIDAFEINEAFAAQTLGCIKQLHLDPAKVNRRGGAIALGHPIGASGARILVTLLHLMEDLDLHRGVASLCVGGGMGVAMAIER